MRHFAALLLVLLAAHPRGGAHGDGGEAADPTPAPSPGRAWEDPGAQAPETPIDRIVAAAQRSRGIAPAAPCSDAVFARRVHVDLAGRLPEPAETAAFVADRSPGKRAALVDRLLASERHADLWSMRWCDTLRVKSEFPINLWPNAVQAYHRWVRDAVRTNLPYDRFATELLASSGSNFREPQVNFLRAVQGRDPASWASAAALTFMGTRISAWPPDRRDALAAFFSRVSIKKTREWKEEVVLCDPSRSDPFEGVLPDGATVRIAGGEDPRAAFAAWLTAPGNPWFARAGANRVWAWLFGRGVVHEADDLRPDNPPSVPGLLEHLGRELELSGYDMRALVRSIVLSRTYQQSPVPRTEHPDAARLFASYPVRPLEAEVLADVLAWIGGAPEQYSSIIPEPFSFPPPEAGAVSLADGSITSRFLETFGRPPRDTGLLAERRTQPTDGQSLHMLNSTDVQRRIERSGRLNGEFLRAKGDRSDVVRRYFLVLLSRAPLPEEADAAAQHLAAAPNVKQGADDLAWALVNSKEFLHRH